MPWMYQIVTLEDEWNTDPPRLVWPTLEAARDQAVEDLGQELEGLDYDDAELTGVVDDGSHTHCLTIHGSLFADREVTLYAVRQAGTWPI